MGLEITDRATALALVSHVQELATARGVALRDPPPEPTTCCGRGCSGCVWESFYDAVSYWYDESLCALAA